MTFSDFVERIFPKKIIIGFLLIHAAIMMIAFGIGFIIYLNFFIGDTYKIGTIEVPSVSYVLNDRRSIFEVATKGDSKTFTYRAVDHPTEDIAIYVDYLLRKEGFELVMAENRGQPSQTITLYKKYSDPISHIFVQIDCQISHYVITIRKEAVS